MALGFGQSMFPKRNYLEGESGYKANIDVNGNMLVSGMIFAGEVTFPSAQSVKFDTAQNVQFPSTQSVSFPTAQDITITNSYLEMSGSVVITGTPNVNISSGSVGITGTPDVTITNSYLEMSGSVVITGTPNVNISSGNVGITGTPDVSITNSYIEMSGTVVGDMNVTNSYFDMNISGATVENNTLVSDWKYLIDHGVLQGDAGNGINNTVTRYTCPGGKKFYIISLTLCLYETAASSAQSNWTMSGIKVLQTTTPGSGVAASPVMITTTIPMVLLSGCTLSHGTVGSGTTTCGYSYAGYEVDA